MSNNKFWSKIRALKEQTEQLITRKTKQVILSAAASLFIGVVLGFISLQMAEKDGSKAETASNSINGNSTEEVITTEPIAFYTIQGGIFEEQANAEQWAESFSKDDFPTMTWKRKDAFYLFAGIGESDEQLASHADEMKDANLNVFVKDWQLNKGELSATETDRVYLQSFLEAWQGSLEKQDTSQLEAFAKESADLSEAVEPLQDKLNKLFKNDQVNDQLVLLEAVYEYENLFQE